MRVIADLQLHSKYSQAVSNKLDILYLYQWARIKGIDLVATGDWTHPLWIREIEDKLEETGRGTLVLKKQFKKQVTNPFPLTKNVQLEQFNHIGTHPEFLLATELSSIYTQTGKSRRVHNLLWAPSLDVVHKITKALLKKGCNLSADGRPIIGLSSIELCELVFGIDDTCMIIPAHAWTPWFAMWGSKSGFDNIDECFGPYADKIYAIETGLSSDPSMNWRIKDLEERSIVSFSDAHSGPKLGREATIFEVEELTYDNIRDAIMQPTRNKLQGTNKSQVSNNIQSSNSQKSVVRNQIVATLEFYPEEGKYHWDGHRACNHRQKPEATRNRGKQCPVCGKHMTVGVEYRIDELAVREPIIPTKEIDTHGVKWNMHPTFVRPKYTNIVPLLEILGEILERGINTKTVQSEYKKYIETIGNEFHVLLEANVAKVEAISGPKMAEALKRVRKGDIFVDPGYDGVFGTVKVWGSDDDKLVDDSKEQMSLL